MFALFNNRQPCQGCMATAITGSFYLTETVTLPANTLTGTRVTNTIDLSAYVNVPTGQCVAIESCDFVHQVGTDYGTDVAAMVQTNGSLSTQLTDLNPAGLLVRADNHSLIASSGLSIDQAANLATATADLYPDNFGPAAHSESFMVVNDTLYLTAGVDRSSTNLGSPVYISVRIRCRVVKLSTKDWMAIAIQSTAEA